MYLLKCIYFVFWKGHVWASIPSLVGSLCTLVVIGSVTKQQHPRLSGKRVSSQQCHSCFYSPCSTALTCGIMNDMLTVFLFIFFSE